MNKFAFNATSFIIKQLYHLSKASIKVGGEDNIPKGSIIFTINHFTRVETLILPYHIQKITKKPVWSLAHHSLFKGPIADFLEKAGAVSTRDPNRDSLIINKLLIGNADWIIFPEGGMIKSKKVIADGDYRVTLADGDFRPRTGAANFALRCQFYKERFKWLKENDPLEMERLKEKFGVKGDTTNLDDETYIVPVNLTYYPIRARENAANHLAGYLMDKVPEKVNEEIMTEGAMLLNGVDIDIRFGKAIKVSQYLEDEEILSDIRSKKHFDFDDKISCLDVLRKNAEKIMYRYMNGIYNMTTINHDHLFSSILKNIPKDDIDPDDLKRRVYLAATLDIDPERLYLHKSLKKNQIPLLTDDRYNKFFEFYEFCREKNILELEDGRLKKNMDKFKVPGNNHDIRGINPVAVFANEIEPLVVLAPHLERLSRESAFNIERRLISYLSTKPIDQFKSDYKKYVNKDVDTIPNEADGYPFLLKGSNAKNGIVLMHGYLSTPSEMRSTAKYFNEKGFSVYSIRFPGHGTSIDNLDDVNHKDWVYAAEEGIALINLMCENLFLCGISLGAAISLILASRLDFIKGVAAIAPPVKFLNYLADSESNQGWKSIMGKFGFKKSEEKDIETCPYPSQTYCSSTPKANKEIHKIIDEMYSNLYHIKTPSIIIQSDNDPVVSPASSKNIYERIAAKDKSLLNISCDGHSIINTDKNRIVFETIKAFFETTME